MNAFFQTADRQEPELANCFLGDKKETNQLAKVYLENTEKLKSAAGFRGTLFHSAQPSTKQSQEQFIGVHRLKNRLNENSIENVNPVTIRLG